MTGWGYAPIDVLLKYTKNTYKGMRELIEGTGKVYPTKGEFERSWGLAFNTALTFTPDSIHQIEERVMEPIRQAANEAGFSFWYSDPNTFHCTLKGGYLPLTEGESRSFEDLFDAQTLMFDQVSQCDALKELIARSRFPAAEFSFLGVGANNLTLNCVSIPGVVADVRQQVEQIFGSFGIRSYNMDNIFHTTLVRLQGRPHDVLDRMGFVISLLRLQEAIAAQPLTLEVEGMVIARDQQRQHRRFEEG